MYPRRGRGRGHEFGGGHGSFGAKRNFSSGQLNASDRDRGTIRIVFVITISLRSVG